jgi:hypothetical protein
MPMGTALEQDQNQDAAFIVASLTQPTHDLVPRSQVDRLFPPCAVASARVFAPKNWNVYFDDLVAHHQKLIKGPFRRQRRLS